MGFDFFSFLLTFYFYMMFTIHFFFWPGALGLQEVREFFFFFFFFLSSGSIAFENGW